MQISDLELLDIFLGNILADNFCWKHFGGKVVENIRWNIVGAKYLVNISQWKLVGGMGGTS